MRNSRSWRNSPGLGHGLKVAVCGHQEAEVAHHLLDPAHRAVAAVLQHAQKGLLDGHGQLPDLVQKQGAPVGLADHALKAAVGPGEGPALVAEELALHELFRQGRAVHHHKGAVGPDAVVVDGAGEELLARAGLPGDEHAGLRGPGLGREVQAGVHGPALADDAAALEPERQDLLPAPVVLHGPLDGQADGVQGRRLGDVAPGPAADGQLRAVRVAQAGEDDDLRRRRAFLKAGQAVQAAAVGHAHVQHHDVVVCGPGLVQTLFQGSGRVRLKTHLLHGQGQRFAQQGIVVHDEHTRHGPSPPAPRGSGVWLPAACAASWPGPPCGKAWPRTPARRCARPFPARPGRCARWSGSPAGAARS